MLCIIFSTAHTQSIKLKAGLIFVPQAEFKIVPRQLTVSGAPKAGTGGLQSGTFAPNLHLCASVEWKNFGLIPFYTLTSNSVGVSPSVAFFKGRLGFYGVASKSLSDGYSGYLGGGFSTPVGGSPTNPIGFAFIECGQVFTPAGQPNYRAFYIGAFVPLFANLN